MLARRGDEPPDHADDQPSSAPMAAPFYRLVGHGFEVEAYDARVVMVSVGAREHLAGEIAELAALRERGVLSDEEFTEAKRRVLGAKS